MGGLESSCLILGDTYVSTSSASGIVDAMLPHLLIFRRSQKIFLIYDISYMWNLKCDTNELISEAETESQA